eukprot:4777966-Amphidinium_carterae.3
MIQSAKLHHKRQTTTCAFDTATPLETRVVIECCISYVLVTTLGIDNCAAVELTKAKRVRLARMSAALHIKRVISQQSCACPSQDTRR